MLCGLAGAAVETYHRGINPFQGYLLYQGTPPIGQIVLSTYMVAPTIGSLGTVSFLGGSLEQTPGGSIINDTFWRIAAGGPPTPLARVGDPAPGSNPAGNYAFLNGRGLIGDSQGVLSQVNVDGSGTSLWWFPSTGSGLRVFQPGQVVSGETLTDTNTSGTVTRDDEVALIATRAGGDRRIVKWTPQDGLVLDDLMSGAAPLPCKGSTLLSPPASLLARPLRIGSKTYVRWRTTHGSTCSDVVSISGFLYDTEGDVHFGYGQIAGDANGNPSGARFLDVGGVLVGTGSVGFDSNGSKGVTSAFLIQGDPGVTALNDWGLWLVEPDVSGSQTRQVLREGQVVDGFTVIGLTLNSLFKFGPARPSYAENVIACRLIGTFEGLPAHAILVKDGSNPWKVIAIDGGSTGPSCSTFIDRDTGTAVADVFSAPSVNARGQVLFHAFVNSDTPGAPRIPTIYTWDRVGGLREIFRSGQRMQVPVYGDQTRCFEATIFDGSGDGIESNTSPSGGQAGLTPSIGVMNGKGVVAVNATLVEVTGNPPYSGESILLFEVPDFDPRCGDLDFNNDGSVFDPQDVEDFFTVFSEGDCPVCRCDPVDFNADCSVFDPDDTEAFLRVFPRVHVSSSDPINSSASRRKPARCVYRPEIFFIISQRSLLQT
jgi:hypothetical protein